MAKVSLSSIILSAGKRVVQAVSWQQQRLFKKWGVYLLCTAVEATIKFTYVEKYPDEPPLWEIHSQENLEDSDAEDILTLLQQQVGPHDHVVFVLTLLIKSTDMLLIVLHMKRWSTEGCLDYLP